VAGFLQIVVYSTARFEEIRAAGKEYGAASPAGPNRVLICASRDTPNRYASIVEFDSYEAAMENSNRPETGEFAARLTAMCDGPPTFYNLDVLESEKPSPAATGFVQAIFYTTTRFEEMQAAARAHRERMAATDATPPTRIVITRNRDEANGYVTLVGFPSFEVAMENSNRPETGEFAELLASFCEGPPGFRNLDVVENYQP
jgi:hypothetical protein